MHRILVLLTAIVCLVSTAARAEETSADKAPSEPNWSIGAGVGWPNASSVVGLGQTTGPGFATNPDSGVASVNAPSSLLSASLFAERRLSDRVWLLGRLSAQYGSTTLENDLLANDGSHPKSQSQSWFGGSVAVGVRSVLGSWSRLQASGFVVGGFGITHVSNEAVAFSSGESLSTDTKFVSTSGGWLAGVSGGVICDIELLRNLGLRVSTPLLNASYTQAQGFFGADTKVPTTKVSGFSAGVAIAPTIELRVLF